MAELTPAQETARAARRKAALLAHQANQQAARDSAAAQDRNVAPSVISANIQAEEAAVISEDDADGTPPLV